MCIISTKYSLSKNVSHFIYIKSTISRDWINYNFDIIPEIYLIILLIKERCLIIIVIKNISVIKYMILY